MSERVLVAMSGGVDSSLAAARLQSQGFDVVGVTLHLWDYPDDGTVQGRCCAPEDIHDAKRVCDRLQVPHFAFDRRELFEREVVTPFVEGYLDGVTPSPCVRCNRGVKIRELIAIANRLGAARIATGHYARLKRPGNRVQLLRAVDLNKDQSYFLHMLPEAVLDRLCFPLGEMSKAEVRAQALELELPGATKGESQELCFVPTGRYDAFVDQRASGRSRQGALLDESGHVVGQHDGVHRYTVGQRKNLGVALGYRAYVTKVDAETATVHLGSRDDLLASGTELSDFHLVPEVSLPLRAQVAVRYRGTLHDAIVTAAAQGAQVVFDQPVAAVVAGQYAVVYDGERVLGGGLIRRAIAEARRHLPLA